MTTYLLSALALTLSSTSLAAEPALAPTKECCCCKKEEQGKMTCCKERAGDENAGHNMGASAPK